MTKPVQLLMPIVIAVILGPLVAGLAFFLFGAIINLFDDGFTLGLPIADVFKLFIIGMLFAYFEGGPIALLAGILVSIWMIWRPPSLFVAVAAALAAIGIFCLAVEIGLLGPSGGNLVRHNLALTLVLGVVAAGGCWLLTRRFARTA